MKRERFTLQKCLKRSDWGIMKIYRIIFFLKERAFYHLKQQIVPSRCKDIFFSVLTVTIILQWLLQHVIEKKISLQKYLNRFGLHIVETLKKNVIYLNRDDFTISTNNKCSQELLNLQSEQGLKYDMFSSIGWHHSMEWCYLIALSYNLWFFSML